MTFCEIRDDSVVVEWKAPIYTGASPITGYFVDFAKKGSDEWHCSNESHAVSHRYHKVQRVFLEYLRYDNVSAYLAHLTVLLVFR